MSTSTEFMAGMDAPAERRFYPRVTPPTPIYVAFGPSNLGTLHNVSENGFQVTTPESLPVNSVFKVFLTLTGASKAISVSVRTIWTEEGQKRSGIQLLDLGEQDRQQVRDWVELESSRNENAGRSGWVRPRAAEEQPIDGYASQKAAPARRPFRERVDPPPVPLNQDAAAASAGPVESNPYANLFAAATNPEEFPPVPLPIHRDFEYQPPIEPVGTGRSRRSRTSRWRGKPLILWAAVLAVVCFGANALVKYKIAATSRRYAAESAKNSGAAVQQNPGADNSAAPADNSSATTTAANDPAATDRNSSSTSVNDAINAPAKSAAPSDTNSNQSSDSISTRDRVRSAPVVDSASGAQNDAPLNPSTSKPRASMLDSERTASTRPDTSGAAPAQTGTETASDVARYRERLREYLAATAPSPAPAAKDSVNAARAANSNASTAPTPAPAANPPSAAPSNSNTTPAATVAASNTSPTPASSAPAQVRTQAPPVAVSPQSAPQTSSPSANTTVAANQAPNNTPVNPANTNIPSRNQSAIYNANSSPQKSAILGSINSVRSSGIFASANAPSAPPPVSPDNSPSPYSAAPRNNSSYAYAASRNAPVNSGTVQMDTQPVRDLQIPAPKGFSASYVEIPGERVIHSPSATIHIQRLVRVPGERVPGQRWLWKGHLDVTLGELMTRVDPSVAQSAATSGSLTVEATVDKDGYVTDLKPLYGNFGMLPAVSRAVRSWRYQPTYLDNKRAETQAKIEFDLHPAAATNRPPR